MFPLKNSILELRMLFYLCNATTEKRSQNLSIRFEICLLLNNEFQVHLVLHISPQPCFFCLDAHRILSLLDCAIMWLDHHKLILGHSVLSLSAESRLYFREFSTTLSVNVLQFHSFLYKYQLHTCQMFLSSLSIAFSLIISVSSFFFILF